MGYIRLLLKFFEVENNKDITSKMLRKYLAKHPKALKHTFIGTTPQNIPSNDGEDENILRSTLLMEIYVDYKQDEKENIVNIRCKLDESKRHKLLCTLLRIKNKHKKRRSTALCIPQPPPPKKKWK